MSLLMDALKRAEESKRQTAATEGGQAGNSGLALEPGPETSVAERSPLPDLSSHLDTVDADLQAEAADQRKPASKKAPLNAADVAAQKKSEQQAERNSARQVFEAKLREDDPSKQRNNIFLLIGIGSLAGLALAGYFGYQYMALTDSSNRLAPVARAQAPSMPITAAPLPAATAPAPATAAAIAASETPSAVASTSAKDSAPEATNTTEAVVAPPKAAVQARPRSVQAPRTAPRVAAPIQVTRSASQLEDALATGYTALQAGDFNTASVAYNEALRSDPNNTNALLGLASIASRQNRPDSAASNYLRILEADPRNAAAHVGLLGLGASGDASQRESRLRSLLASQTPHSAESGMLNFGLGNLFAAQRRWSEAQQAFFSAHASDAANPDYLFNLAVSLDHLQKPSLALQYYESARTAATNRQASFDSGQVDTRIGELRARSDPGGR